jgi:hypothetical protein
MPTNWRPTVPDERIDEALAFMQLYGYAPSLDEWNAARLSAGHDIAGWTGYIEAIDAAGDVYYRDTLVYFGAVDEVEL